jgi:hypothetical protein
MNPNKEPYKSIIFRYNSEQRCYERVFTSLNRQRLDSDSVRYLEASDSVIFEKVNFEDGTTGYNVKCMVNGRPGYLHCTHGLIYCLPDRSAITYFVRNHRKRIKSYTVS